MRRRHRKGQGAGGRLIIGGFPGIFRYFAVVWKGRMGYDDPLDVVGIHGVGGLFGILATGLYASRTIRTAGADGLIFGNAGPFGIQAITVASVALLPLIGIWIILKMVDAAVGLRVSPENVSRGWTSANIMNAPIHKRTMTTKIMPASPVTLYDQRPRISLVRRQLHEDD